MILNFEHQINKELDLIEKIGFIEKINNYNNNENNENKNKDDINR
jgi:hypothetical protein